MEAAIISLTQGALPSLLCKLGGLLAGEGGQVHGVHGEIQYIKDELESMNAFLRNLAMSEEHDDQVRTWMKQVREVAYDAEDCIDEFNHHLFETSRNELAVAGFLHRFIRNLSTLKCRRRFAVQLQELKARARDVGDRRARYGVVATTQTVDGHGYSRLDPRLHALFTEEAQLVGIDEPRDELVGWLMEDERRLRVLAIVGFGGLGKTTLARMVCGSPAVKGAGFLCCPLVIVSQAFNAKTLLQHILRELIQRPWSAMAEAERSRNEQSPEDTLEGMEGWEVPRLARELRLYLEDKRYIVILDDIWTISVWENIRYAFPDNNKGSRILVTTRNEDVANTCCSCSQDRIYKIKRLSDMASQELFFKRIFGSVGILPNNELVEVSNSILRKCGGLPLAIVSIGSLLASKPNRTKEEWQKVCDNLGSELETNPTLEGAKQVLTLSYNDLPYHLKTCFLYLSIFPESNVIKRGPLVRKWIAEGFVIPRHGLSMEQVAESYFDEFVSRSIVQPIIIDWRGKVRSCRVHDIMLEVIISKSLEENFASILRDNGSTSVTHDKIRRLSLHSSHHPMQKSSASVAHVRSFTVSPSIEEVPCFFPQIRLVRVLDMEGCSCLSTNHLDSICKFFQLKYVSLRKTNVSKLPRLLGNLKHLETLDIRATLIKTLPASAANLNCMKHLLVGHKLQLTRTASVKYFRPSSGLEVAPGMIKNMKDLQSLAHIVVRKQSSVFQEVGLLQKIRKLKVLFCSVDVNWKHFLESLGKLTASLRCLSISVLEDKERKSSLDMLALLEPPPLSVSSLSLRGQLQSLPPWLASLKNVSKLTLRLTELGAEAMEVLENLPNLLCLKLYHKSYSDNCIGFRQGKFASLRLLIIDNLENIDKVHFEEGSVPNLERLTLSFLREPTDGILGLKNLLKLREVEFFGDIIESVVDKVTSDVRAHPNRPRVIGERWNVVTEYA